MGYTYEQLKSMGAVPGSSGAGGDAALEAPAAPAAVPQSVVPTGATGPAQKKKYTYQELVAQGATPASPAPTEQKGNNILAAFAKGVFGAPATLLARPVQAVAGLAGVSNEDIDTATKKIPILGDLIAPTPKNFGDIPAEVGRGAQTVALGLGPIAGGALFGAGTSLEQGDDLLSTQTAFNVALGAAGGKILGLVGKPLLNATGKVVGTITPKVLKDVATSGAKGIQEFAANHQILGGVAAPLSESLAKGGQAIDNAVDNTFKKGGQAVKDVASKQFPQLNPTNHYTAVNERDILRPTTVNEPKYHKATAVYNDAKAKGIDLEKVASERGIIHDQIAEGGKYNTLDAADNLRQNNYQVSDTIARPAIKAAEPGVALVPLEQVRSSMISRINKIPASQIGDEERATLIKQIKSRYADGSAADTAHPNGYSLTELHDARIAAQKNGGYKVGQSASDALKAQRSREEGRVFSEIFDSSAPEELGIKPFKKELEKNFLLADYLESLNTKKVPAGITKKAVRLFGRAVTATVGGKIGGFPGSILGAQYGDMLFNSFETLPNPIKMAVLQAVKKEDPKIFGELVKYIGTKETERLMTKGLPSAGGSAFKETPPTIFTTPGGKSTTIKGEAADVAAVEQGRAKQPGTDRRLKSYLDKVNYAQGADGVYTNPKDLPTIKMGPKKKSPKRLNDIY